MINLKGNEKILIIKPSAFGDILHALPLLDRIKTVYPEISVSWVASLAYTDMLTENKLIDKLFIFDRKKWGRKRNILKTLRESKKFILDIRKEQFDIVIDLQGLLRSGVITFLSGAPIKIGLSDSREGSRFFYNRIVTVHDKKRHAVDRYLKVFDLLDNHGNKPRGVSFPVCCTEEADKFADNFFADNKIYPQDKVIALNPNARWESKCWNSEKFSELADLIACQFGAKVIFIGGPSDKPSVEKIIFNTKSRPFNLAGKTGLLELASLLKRVDCLVTNDSGPMHLAVAVHTPVIALFGPTDPVKTGPYGKGNEVIRKDIECSFCFKRVCPTKKCMALISVEEVLDNIKKVLFKPQNDKKNHSGKLSLK